MTEARRVSEAEVLAVPEVPFTKSWNPIHHGLLLEVLDETIQGTEGLGVVNREYSLSRNGKDMFFSWVLDQNGEGKRWMVGGRNSMQMHFALGICAGLHITVCANMVLSGTFMEFRRHTSGLVRGEIERIAGNAVSGVITELPKLDQWHGELKETELPDHHFKVLTFEAMKAGAFPPSQFEQFLTHYEEEKEVNVSPGTLFDFHGAGTRAMRSSSLFQVDRRSRALNYLVKNYRPEDTVPVAWWRTTNPN